MNSIHKRLVNEPAYLHLLRHSSYYITICTIFQDKSLISRLKRHNFAAWIVLVLAFLQHPFYLFFKEKYFSFFFFFSEDCFNFGDGCRWNLFLYTASWFIIFILFRVNFISLIFVSLFPHDSKFFEFYI